MRLSEINGLRWDQVDFLSNTTTLNAEERKTCEGRTVPVAAALRTLLLAQRQRRQEDCPFVCFKLEKGGNAVKLESFRKAWASGCTRAGVSGLLFHDLRRSAVRNLVRSGVPEKVCMSISGHKTRAVFDRYSIVNDSDRAAAARKLETFFKKQNRAKTGTNCTEIQQHVLPN